MDFEEIVRRILVGALPPQASEDDGLVCMIILHTHQLKLSSDKFGDTGVDPLTRRHAADLLASVWSAKDQKRTDPTYWYWLYDDRTPFEVASDITPEWKARVAEVRRSMIESGTIAGFVEE